MQPDDDMDELMPRIKAARDRAPVDREGLQKYLDASKHGIEKMMGKRSGVIIRSDVRRDEQGFEDIDDFWAQDQSDRQELDEEDDGEETSIASEDANESSVHVSISSISSSPIRMAKSAVDNATETVEKDAMVSGVSDDSNDTMELDSPDVRPQDANAASIESANGTAEDRRRALESAAQDLLAKKRSGSAVKIKEEGEHEERSQDTSFGDNAAEVVDEASMSSPSLNDVEQDAQQAILTPPVKEKRLSTAPNSEKETHKKAKKSRWKGTPSAEKALQGFDGETKSPFSLGADAPTPLSNASDRHLHSIKPFSERPSDSPEIRVQLFTMSKSRRSSVEEILVDDRNVNKRRRSTRRRSSHTEIEQTPPKRKRKIAYKSTPPTDISIDPAQTDNDSTFHAASDDEASVDHNKSFQADSSKKALNITDLSHASEILRDTGKDDGNPDGLRRSKRRRIKPLAWYKGEHYVYERRESGVGLVIPTVARIERAGTKTPIKTERKVVRRNRGNTRKSVKPLPRSKLPQDFEFMDDEWADLYDAGAGCENRMNVICRADEIDHRELPAVEDLPPGYAGQSFNLRCITPFSRWISGRLGLPPGAAKEAESVGDAVQVFIVLSGQPQALEVAFGPVSGDFFDNTKATRFIVSPGDEFYVPSSNAYYLKNHSPSVDAELRFMIMKPERKEKQLSKDNDE